MSYGRQLSASKAIRDLDAGDYVKRVLGSGKVGLVEEVHSDGFAWVAWSGERRDYLPLAALRKIRPGGHEFDARRT
jgi:hypothetical protein